MKSLTTMKALLAWLNFRLDESKTNNIIVATHIMEQNIQKFVNFKFPNFKRNTATYCREWRKLKRNPPSNLTIFQDYGKSAESREDYYIVVRKDN